MADNVWKLVPLPEPWTPAQATERLRKIAQEANFSLTLTNHAEDQMNERGITTIDVMYVLKNGFVYDPPQKSDPARILQIRNDPSDAELKSPRGADSRNPIHAISTG
jgi:hypothetical protein